MLIRISHSYLDYDPLYYIQWRMCFILYRFLETVQTLIMINNEFKCLF